LCSAVHWFRRLFRRLRANRGPKPQVIHQSQGGCAILHAECINETRQAQDLKGLIRDYITQNFLFEDTTLPYDDEASLLGQGIIDSMGVMQMVMYVQSTFGITVEPVEVTPGNFDSVNNLANYISRKGVHKTHDAG